MWVLGLVGRGGDIALRYLSRDADGMIHCDNGIWTTGPAARWAPMNRLRAVDRGYLGDTIILSDVRQGEFWGEVAQAARFGEQARSAVDAFSEILLRWDRTS